MRRGRPYPGRAGRRGAFTVVEVLATLALAGIVLPAVVHGILLCLGTAGYARQQAQAASLAQSKLAEIVAAGELYDAETTGDFGEDLPGYRWAAEINEWEDSRLVQVDVAVTWIRRGRQRQVTVMYTGRANE